jgi:hypothetical protein
MKGLMHKFLILISLMILTGCANQPVADNPAADLERSVGQDVTLSGKFELVGKVGPYIYCSGQPVYLVPQGSYTWGSQYDSMEGKDVSISGVLHYRHFERARTSDAIEQPVDYFYFDAETAKVALK